RTGLLVIDFSTLSLHDALPIYTLHYCRRHKVPVILANARLSERSARGYGRVGALARPMLQDLSLIAAQSEADAKRFRDLGVPARSEEHTSELQSREKLVCRLLL